MQQNFKEKNTSHLIRLTDAQKKKARRRLIGSIFLLLLSLIVLLDVTSKVNPNKTATKPINISINNTASQVVAKPVASATVTNTIAATENVNHPMVATAANSKVNASKTNTKNASQSIAKKADSFTLDPIIISDDNSNNPKSILNAESSNVKYFVQLIASKDYKKIMHLQDAVAKKGILFEVDPVVKNNTTIYRLRAGPFSSHDDAINFKNNIKQLNTDDLNLK
jgi:cell division septation protein DedD